ncbi:LysE family transporter [Kitasatospora sp. MAP5-34]|uniref:LysE family transporter n=1 Tax=Kitasatospora sp. MAP5-34 TaxID=3035102 RepID=UPI002475FBEC|nr:LysE family transporter [Kitasatospora sp. MAP5-34]MDH6574590.1 threonine/homoserine/homoserine lactone efflux protein [Kitasatospora sp. MAP5-34]
MNDILIAGMLAGYGIAMPVGAITVLIVTLSAQTSFRVGFAGAMGTATADGLYALIAASTGAALASLLQPVARPMRWVAAAVLVLLAVKGITAALRRSRGSGTAKSIGAERPLRAYLQLLGLTILNPLTIIYFSALVLGLRNDAWTAMDSVVFVLAAFAASASWQAVLAIGGALVGRVLTSEKGRLGTAIIGNGVIVFLAAHLLLT